MNDVKTLINLKQIKMSEQKLINKNNGPERTIDYLIQLKYLFIIFPIWNVMFYRFIAAY